MSNSEGCFLKTLNSGCLTLFVVLGGIIVILLTESKKGTATSRTPEPVPSARNKPSQSPQAPIPVPAPTPDWGARHSELYQMHLSKFISPSVGQEVTLYLNNGSTIKGAVQSISDSEIRVQHGAASIGILDNQLKSQSRIQCFARDYAAFKADIQIMNEKKALRAESLIENESVPIIINIRRIAGKTPEDVSRILGQPSEEESTQLRGRSYPKKYYRAGDIEVVYINGLADLITIYGKGQLAYDRSALMQLGLPDHEPTRSNDYAIRWNNVSGFKEINLSPSGQGKVYFAYICVNTVP